MIEPERPFDEALPQKAKSPSSRPTSLSLLQKARHHDGDAWQRIVHLYSPLVYFWCRRQGVRPPDADDILQELLRTAVARLGDFRRQQATAEKQERFLSEIMQRIPMKRTGEPSEILGLALYLAAPASAYLTGQLITQDGGWTAC